MLMFQCLYNIRNHPFSTWKWLKVLLQIIWFWYLWFISKNVFLREHPCSTYAKFSEKLTFLTPWYAHERFGITNYQYFRYIRSIFMNQQKYNLYSMVIRRSVLLHWFSFRLCPMKLVSFKLLLAIAYVVNYQNWFVFWRSVLSSEEQLKSYDFF